MNHSDRNDGTLSRISIAFAMRSVDRSLFIRLIAVRTLHFLDPYAGGQCPPYKSLQVAQFNRHGSIKAHKPLGAGNPFPFKFWGNPTC